MLPLFSWKTFSIKKATGESKFWCCCSNRLFQKNIYLWWKSLKWKFSLKNLHFSRKNCDLFSIFSCPKIVIQYPIFHGKNLFRRFLQTYCQIIHSPKILFRRENHLETKTFVNSLLRFGTQTFSIFQNSKLLKTCNFANS